MKTRILLVFCLFLLARISTAQYVTIPDANFRAFLKQSYPTCFNSQDMMDTTCSAVLTAKSMGCYNSNIADLQGIQYFKGLDSLDCNSNRLTSLPALPSGLTYLNCDENQLTSLPTLPSGLTSLDCWRNQLTSLPTLPSGLTYLHCGENQLTSLPTLPSGLTYLHCGQNRLTSLPAFPSGLTQLFIGRNPLTTTIPPLPNGLRIFDCSVLQLTRLPALPNGLESLDCSGNQLTILPNMNVTSLWCSNNPNLDCLPAILGYQCYIEAYFTNINCVHISIGHRGYLRTCQSGEDNVCNENIVTLTGRIYLDANINGQYDLGERLLPNFTITTQPGNGVHNTYGYGNYSFTVDTLVRSISILNPYPQSITIPVASYSFTPTPRQTLNYDFAVQITPPNTYVEIPDVNFRDFLKLNYPNCFLLDMMDTTCSAVLTARSIDCQRRYITNLQGIQYFKGLDSLNCSDNRLTSLPILPNSLTKLHCNNNQLASLPTLPNSLTKLYCENNQLASLPTLPNSLTKLYCNTNRLTSLPALPSGLAYLECNTNQLTSLPVLPSTLTSLFCHSNQLTSLPILPNGLIALDCHSNQLTRLPALSSSLIWLDCSRNRLINLPALPSTLIELDCYFNPNLSCLPILPNGLRNIDMWSTQVTCLPNRPLGITSSLRICTDPTKVCNRYAFLTGKVYFDANNNNQYDTNEKLLPSFILSPQPITALNPQFLSTSTGYSFWVDSLARGINVTNPYPQAFTVPVSSYSFTPTQGQALDYNFGVRLANTSYNELESVVAPFVARPGFTSGIVGTVRNVGSTNPIPTVVMRIPTGWVVDSLKPAGGLVQGDSVTWNVTTPFDFFEERQFFVWAKLPRTTPLGSPYCVSLTTKIPNVATIVSNKNLPISCGVVVGSYDPNDKLVKPAQMPPSYNPEEELVYTIRFQNTGTYYAENVMVLDTISSLLRLETFRLLNKSHNCEVSFKPGRIIEFAFYNIMLLDSNTNEPASHGFVQFAMKPVANLPLNTSIGNKGYIYFDFNDPIITNTARTNVSVLGIEVSPEMRLLIAPNPATESCRVEFDTRGKLGTLTLTDALGRTVKSVELQGNGQHDFSVADMPSGVYYLRVNAEGKLLASGKLVVEK